MLVAAFIDAVCTRRWLGWQYTNSTCGSLAGGLRLLVLSQPPHVCWRFHNPGLGIRLQKELPRFSEVTEQEQGQIIQLLGSATLFGLSVKSEWFATCLSVPLADCL